MKREGDSVLSILVEVLSYIYAGEGYYVCADRLFYEDLSAGLYENSSEDVERIVRLAVEYGLFDAGLFERYCILTSVEIQRQYLFSTRRRSTSHLENAYCLLANEELSENQLNANKKTSVYSEAATHVGDTSGDDNVAFIPENVTSGTHSIEQHSVAEQSKEYPLLNPPLKKAGRKGMELEKRKFLLQVPAGRIIPFSIDDKCGRRRLLTGFTHRLTGHHAITRDCLIISGVTGFRFQSNMLLSGKVTSELLAVQYGKGLPRCVAVAGK